MPHADLFNAVREAPSWWLCRASLPACLVDGIALVPGRDGIVSTDILISDGRIAAIEPAGPREGPVVDLDKGMVWPAFVDMHTHLDKGHIWPRRSNPDGTFDGALANANADRDANWCARDVSGRMEFALRAAFAHGTRAIRTHLDSVATQFDVTWDVFDEMRARWSGRIALQAVSLFAIDDAASPQFLAALAERVADSGGVFGAVTFMTPGLEELLHSVFATAAGHGLDLDFHVDESLDPGAQSLEVIARTAIDTGFAGRVVCGHCCSLSVCREGEESRVLDLVAEAGIAVVSLPMCNLYLQDRRGGTTPRRRGITLIQEMRARGIPVAVASDNTRDPFYAYGDLDPLEVFREAVRIGHLDHPIDDAPQLVTRAPADIIGLEDCGRIAVGAAADLVLFDGRDYSELLSRPEAHRAVLRAGRAIERRLPDYRELDDLLGVT